MLRAGRCLGCRGHLGRPSPSDTPRGKSPTVIKTHRHDLYINDPCDIIAADCRVRKHAIQKWLEYLRLNHPAYTDIQINVGNLQSLPANGDVFDNLRTYETEEEEAGTNEALFDLPPQTIGQTRQSGLTCSFIRSISRNRRTRLPARYGMGFVGLSFPNSFRRWSSTQIHKSNSSSARSVCLARCALDMAQ